MLSRPAPAGDAAPPPIRASVGAGAAAFVATLSMLAYRANVDRYYGSFIPQGTGMDHIVSEELAQLSLYVVFGFASAMSLGITIYRTRVIERALALAASAHRRPRPAIAVLAGFVLLTSFVVGRIVLGGMPTTDDESVYRFIAQTLRTGSLVAPSPGHDLEFYREQFVVLTPTARYGKYPIGHPLLLALGEVVSAGPLVPPIAAALTLLLTYAAGGRVLGAVGALLGTMLLATSPQFLLTAGTWLSQTSSTVFVMAALAALLAAEDRRPRGLWLAVAGSALGYAFLVRPMPAGALAAGATAWLLAGPRERAARHRVLDVILFVLPLTVALALFLLVNRLQSGAAWTTGYQAFHGTQAGAVGIWAETLGVDLASASASVFAALFRENVWLLGWPLSLLPCLMARRNRRAALLWGVVGVALAYRVLVPKAGVSPTGPVYFSEAVPALCLLAADGLLRLARGETAAGAVLAQWTARPRAAVAALTVASSLTGLTLFTLDRVADLGRMAAAQDSVWRLVQERGIHHALVFHSGVVPPWTRLSWAYFPRCNSPALDDDVLFVRYRADERGADTSLRFWRDRHADRSAYLFFWPPGQPAALLPLEAPPADAPGPR
jgi:hypothetical protein